MIRRRRGLLTLASALIMIASVPGPASASHTLPGDYYPIQCISGAAPPIGLKYTEVLFTGNASCIGSEEPHFSYGVSRAAGVEAKGIVTLDPNDGTPLYSALRPGRDQVIVNVSDGMSQGQTTIDLEIEPQPTNFPFVDDQELSRKHIFSLGAAGCPGFPFPVGSCTAKIRARASIRERGKPRKTVTIGRVSTTLMPGQVKDIKVRLSKKFVRVLTQARQMKVAVVQMTKQTDPLGLYEETIKDDFDLYP